MSKPVPLPPRRKPLPHMDDGDRIARVDPFAAARRLQTPTWLYDIDTGYVLHANAAACKLWQADSEQELQRRDMAQGMSASVATRLKQYQADFIEQDATFSETWTLFPNGEPTSVKILFSGFQLPDGRMAMQCEVAGGLEQQTDNLRSVEALLHTDVMITLYAQDGPPLYRNPAARNVSHAAHAPLPDVFVDPLDYDLLVFDLDGGGEHRRIVQIKTAGGNRWFDFSAKRCSDAVTGDPAILVTAIDVSELKLARDKARYLASRDQLTGCYNRSYLQTHMSHLTRSAAPLSALLYFDVDRFKQINDTFGHEVGDAVLVALAERTNGYMSPDDAVVRLGGDEFVVILGDASNAAFTDRVETIFQALSAPTKVGSVSIKTRVSIGVALFEPGARDVDVILRQADIALYLAKKNGRNQYVTYDAQMGVAAEKRRRTEAELELALKRQEFELHYQPRLDLRTGSIASVEGLARWRHPERGLVAPDEFIPICEETGLIHALGQQVLEMGFAQAMEWQRAGIDRQLSLNISPRQFSDARFEQMLTRYAQMDGFPAHKIELEVTENVLIAEQDGIAAKLQVITDMGYRIAIDDFGTGFSNLSYISRFPLHCLKIDRSFIAQLPQSGPIVQLILSLGQQIGVTIVAEGVETKEQFEWLDAHRCDQIQGFYIARPLPVHRLET